MTGSGWIWMTINILIWPLTSNTVKVIDDILGRELMRIGGLGTFGLLRYMSTGKILYAKIGFSNMWLGQNNKKLFKSYTKKM